MNHEEAFVLFGLTNAASGDEIREAVEQKLFEQKNDVLQKYMVPALLVKKTRLLEQLAEASELLMEKASPAIEIMHDLEGPYHTQTQFLLAYEKNVSDLKLHLMNVSSFDNLMHVVHEFSNLQEIYMEMFREQFNEYSEALPEEVNTRDIIDTGTLLQGLKAGELHAHMIWSIEKELARISKIMKLS